jgi:hypothetical protein
MSPAVTGLLTQDALTQHLRETNSRLCGWLEDLVPDRAPEPASEPAAARPATPRQMAALLAELMRAGQCLREMPSEKEPALELEVNAYRKNVERLRGLMPAIHSALLRERARLEQERARVESAAEWVRRSRQTF